LIPIYCKNKDNVKQIIDEYIRQGNYVVMSMYSSRDISRRMIDTIMFDVDGRDINDSYDKLMKLMDYFNDLGLIVSRVYASVKGFHVYVDFDRKVQLKTSIPGYYKQINSKLVQEIGKVIDDRYIGLSDIPYGYKNPKYRGERSRKYYRVNHLAKDLDTMLLAEKLPKHRRVSAEAWVEVFGVGGR